jgi:competence ComEA-like helix-hairpin-helix protein
MSLDVNDASREDLVALAGIGEDRADAIIRARPFSSIDDLLSIPGIGKKTLERLKRQGLTLVSKQTEEEAMADQMMEETLAGDMTMPNAEMAVGEEMDVLSSAEMAEAGEMDVMPGEDTTVAEAGEMDVMPGEVMTEAGAVDIMPGEDTTVAEAGEMNVMPGEDTTVAGAGGMEVSPGAEMALAMAAGEIQALELTGTWKLTFSLASLKSSGRS